MASTASYRDTKSSQLRRAAHSKMSKSEEVTTRPPTAPSYATSSTQTPKTVKNATVHDADFEETQLKPRGIEIVTLWDPALNSSTGTYAYFNSQEPPDSAQSREFYRSLVEESLKGRVEPDIDDSLFLPMDAGFVQSVLTGHHSLGQEGLPEPEFKLFAFQKLFIGHHILAKGAGRQLRAVRSVEWSLKPNESQLWRAPPILSGNPLKPFGFDIYSDCQFWLCNRILNPRYRAHTRHTVYLKALGTFCPYFSIEFKSTIDDTRTVQNQVAAAGSISLFNRYHLKLYANPLPTSEQWKLVCHYGLTMEKANWAVWLFELKLVNGAWAGCKMRRLDAGSCTDEHEVLGLISWINEIHRWGLCTYALECEEDIKRILSKDSKLRVSDIRVPGTDVPGTDAPGTAVSGTIRSG